ncbi:MAG: hypothetical protein AB8F95_19875 [Bacteroidia bacterium]
MRTLLLFIFCSTMMGSFAQNQIAAYLAHTDSMEVNLIKRVNNYTYDDKHPSLSPDGKTLYFASERGQTSWAFPYMDTRKDSTIFHLPDLWRSTREGAGWSKPECLPFGLNSSREDHSPIITSEDLYFFSMNPDFAIQQGPFFRASETANLWDPPVGLGGGLTTFFVKNGGEVDGFTFGPKQKWLVFSWGKAGEQKDLFISIDQGKKGWTVPRKMAISTPNDDIAPTVTSNGKSLIFSTPNLKEGFGGYDLVMVRMGEDGRWGNIINLSAPFNSDEDETGITFSANNRTAILVRNGQLYEVKLAGAHPYLQGE